MTDLDSFFDFNSNRIQVRFVNGEPVFSIPDVCKILGIANPSQVITRLDKEDLIKIEALNLRGASHEIWFCFEPGLYDLILRSNKPEAIEFKRWIRKVLLPSVRKAGSIPAFIEQYVRIEPRRWQKTFQDEFFAHCRRLKLFPSQTILKYFYNRFPSGVMEKINELNPLVIQASGNTGRNRKIFQYLTDEVGLPELMYRMGITMAIMSTAKDKKELELMDRAVNGIKEIER